MDRRQRGRRAAHSSVGGGFTILRNWGASRVTGILTLLLLSLFTGAIALGAASVFAAVVAFVFLGGALALATAAQARSFYAAVPPQTGPPLEKVADFRIDDITIEEEDDGDVNSMDALSRTFGNDSTSTAESSPAADDAASGATAATDTDRTEQPAPKTESTTAGATTKTPAEPEADPAETDPAETDPADDSEAAPRNETTAAESAAPQTSASPPRQDAPDADSPADGGETTVLPAAEAAIPDPRRPQEDSTAETSAEQPDTAPGTTDSTEPAAASDEPTENQDAEPSSTAESSSSETSEPAPEPESTPRPPADTAAESTPDTDDTAVPAVAGNTALSLLAAETPGTNLLAAYTSETPQVPPEAVRDVAATLIVSNLERSIMFYTELLGLVEIDRAPDAVLLEAGFGRVLLWQRDEATETGDPVMHLTFEVGDIDSAYETLRVKGVRFTHSPVAALSGEVHSLRVASFQDPDGHGLAITQLREH